MGRTLWREDRSVFTIADGTRRNSLCRGTQDQILLLQMWGSPNLERQDPVFISTWNRVAQLYPRALGLPNSFTCY
jgi:hypothetical protein